MGLQTFMMPERFYYRRLSSSSDDVEKRIDPLAPETPTAHHCHHGSTTWRLLVSALIVSNLVFCFLWLRSVGAAYLEPDCVRPKLAYSPALSAIGYERKTLDRNIQDNVFTGAPRPELDAAWGNLIEPISLKITAEELSHVPGGKSIAFKDGSGYLAELSVYHELHCVKHVRRHLHLEYYGQLRNATQSEIDFETAHVDHCLEYWREAALCRADTSLSTYFWKDQSQTFPDRDRAFFPASHVFSTHECVNFERIDAWARERMVDLSSYDVLEDAPEVEDSSMR